MRRARRGARHARRRGRYRGLIGGQDDLAGHPLRIDAEATRAVPRGRGRGRGRGDLVVAAARGQGAGQATKLCNQVMVACNIATIAEAVNARTDNIGARRLHTLMERLLEDVLFDAPEGCPARLTVDAVYVADKLKAIKDDEDLSRYIL